MKISCGIAIACTLIFFVVQLSPMLYNLPIWVDGWSLIGIVVFGVMTVVFFVIQPSETERKLLNRELPPQDHWWGKGV